MKDIEYLFQKYKDDVYRMAVSYTNSQQDAEDVCQNVFFKLMKQPHIDPGKERSWLLKVTANECRSLLRSSWWRTTVPLETASSVPMADSCSLLEVLLQMKPKYRVVLYLHYYEGFNTTEISKLLHISQSAVTTRLSRGRRELKNLIEEDAL